MPVCPRCKCEYREGFKVCADCGVELVDGVWIATEQKTWQTVVSKWPRTLDELPEENDLIRRKRHMTNESYLKRNEDAIKGAIVCFVMLVIFGVMAVLALNNIITSHHARNWPSVQGYIVSIETAFTGEGTGEGGTWTLSVDYKYSVDGHAYRSERTYEWIWFLRYRARKMESLRQNHPAITVYYDPSDPSVSTLDQGIQWRYYLLEPIAGILALISIAVVVLPLVVRIIRWWERRQ